MKIEEAQGHTVAASDLGMTINHHKLVLTQQPSPSKARSTCSWGHCIPGIPWEPEEEKWNKESGLKNSDSCMLVRPAPKHLFENRLPQEKGSFNESP